MRVPEVLPVVLLQYQLNTSFHYTPLLRLQAPGRGPMTCKTNTTTGTRNGAGPVPHGALGNLAPEAFAFQVQ